MQSKKVMQKRNEIDFENEETKGRQKEACKEKCDNKNFENAQRTEERRDN